ncbi:MAG: hypothetical protein ACFFBP_17925 [Promethearchaeota archaeon]
MYKLSTLPVTIVFILNGIGHLYYGYRLKKKFPEYHNFYDTIMLVCLWTVAGIFYPLYYLENNPILSGYLNICTLFICIFTPFIIFLILYYQKLKIKKNSTVRDRRTVDKFIEDHDLKEMNKTHSYKTDLTRKLLHLFPAVMIIFLWVFAVNIWGTLWNQGDKWGITSQDFGRILILTVGYSGILIFAALDYVRLSPLLFKRNLFHLLPDNVSKLLGNAMKGEELYEFTKPATLILAFATIFLFPFPIFCAAALIATIGDGAASVLGKRFGKINFPKSSEKTIIGYISGFLASLGVIYLSLILFVPDISIIKCFIISLVGALVFFIIDISNVKLDDNILNPIISAIFMNILFYLL